MTSVHISKTKTQIAIENARTVFATKVKSVSDGMGKTELVIKRSSNTKLGKTITKGTWEGFPIYTVTLEERATCPNSCVHWSTCYGNNMFRAIRYSADDSLILAMHHELADLQAKHPKGFAVRLHVLGDFYSVDYVKHWAQWLDMFPALHVWGYTARKDKTDPIASAILDLICDQPKRFKVRFSGDMETSNSALSMDAPRVSEMVASKVAFLCPQQTGKTATCGTCAACWASDKPVAFLTH